MSFFVPGKSILRYVINKLTRNAIRDEALRKQLVERHYAFKTSRINRDGIPASRMADDLLDWRKTMAFRLECSREIYRANSFYGIGKCLRNYAGVQTCIKACAEHGVYFGSYVNEQELDSSGLPCLFTFGAARLDHIRSASDVPVVTVGPYIAYAEDYLDLSEVSKAREALGRMLLVFPSHSVDRVKVDYEMPALVDAIEEVRADNGINTVLICLYYRDLLNGAAEAYENLGYRVVTAGYREDPLFLSRQRSLIGLADITMSNNVGTHVGYCAWLGKPHYVFNQEKHYSSNSSLDDSEFDNDFAASQAAEKNEVASAFSHLIDKRTPEQDVVLHRYWGFGNVKSRKEIAALLAACEKAYGVPSRDRQKVLRGLVASDRSLAGMIE